MGQKHFQQLYADALAVDCRAYATAWRMRLSLDPRFPADGALLASRPFDLVMVCARRLLQVWDAYVAELKELHAADRVRIYGRTRRGPVRIDDVRVLEDESDTLEPAVLYRYMPRLAQLR